MAKDCGKNWNRCIWGRGPWYSIRKILNNVKIWVKLELSKSAGTDICYIRRMILILKIYLTFMAKDYVKQLYEYMCFKLLIANIHI